MSNEQQPTSDNQDQKNKEEGKVQPIKLTKEELERRKETGYKTDLESQRTPSGKGGQVSSQGAEESPAE